MKLAQDETRIMLGDGAVTLRPTLRAALRLERRFGGFDKIIRQLLDGSVGTMAAIIAEAASDKLDAADVLDTLAFTARHPLHTVMETLGEPILAFVFSLAGIEADELAHRDDKTAEAARMTFAEYHVRLFRIATGWLSWSPEDAWNATPAEITEAYNGRVEMLRAIFGGSDDAGKADANLSLEDKFARLAAGLSSRAAPNAKAA